MQHRDRPTPRTYLGTGRLEELTDLVDEPQARPGGRRGRAEPRQQRALEDRLKTRVVDRTGVILDIFALHARSAEGKLQVELAQLEYSYARQEGLWQHLERLGGGVGTRGPGESQLESDRRMIRTRMGSAAAATARRGPQPRDHARGPHGSATTRVALAGYTNAGKSSLMNALTGAARRRERRPLRDARRDHAQAHEGRHEGAGVRHGRLHPAPPPPAGERSRSTLEEVRDAHLIVHVADASERRGTRRDARAAAVEEVLDEIGAAEVPRLLVLNKVDLVAPDDRAALRFRHPRRRCRCPGRHARGARRPARRGSPRRRARGSRSLDITIPYSDSGLIAAVYADGSEVTQEATEEGMRMHALMPAAAAAPDRATLDGARAG